MILRRCLFILAFVGMCGPPLFAQKASGAITSTECVSVNVEQQSTVGIQVTGTWAGTLQPKISIQGQAPQNIQVVPSTSSTAQSTITGNGVFQARVAGGSTFLVCGNSVSSGTANVFLNSTTAVSLNGLGGGGGGGSSAFNDITSGTNTTAAMVVGAGATLSSSGGAITATAVPFSGVTSTPATLAGYGITDAVPSSLTVNGKALSGNITLGLASADFANQGTTTTLLHGNAAGNPAFGAVDLANDVSGNLGVSHLNGGTGASASTYWRGDGTWVAAANTALSNLSSPALNTDLGFNSHAATGVTAVASATLNPADAGFIRAAKSDVFNFRNEANSGNIQALAKASDDSIVLGGTPGVQTQGPISVSGSGTPFVALNSDVSCAWSAAAGQGQFCNLSGQPTWNDNNSSLVNFMWVDTPVAGIAHITGSGGEMQSSLIASADINNGAVTGTKMASQYPKFSCQSGWGDGLNAIPAGTYLMSFCYNDTGVTWTIAGIRCDTDNSGSTTLNATNGSGTGLLTGAVTCTTSWAAGTQSATTTIASGDYIKFTTVADGTSKQINFAVALSK